MAMHVNVGKPDVTVRALDGSEVAGRYHDHAVSLTGDGWRVTLDLLDVKELAKFLNNAWVWAELA